MATSKPLLSDHEMLERSPAGGHEAVSTAEPMQCGSSPPAVAPAAAATSARAADSAAAPAASADRDEQTPPAAAAADGDDDGECVDDDAAAAGADAAAAVPRDDLEDGELEDGELEDDDEEEEVPAPMAGAAAAGARGSPPRAAASGDEAGRPAAAPRTPDSARNKRKSLLRPGELYESAPSAGSRAPLPPLEDEYADYEASLQAGHARYGKRRRTERTHHKSPAICSYYMQGKCQKGRGCQFSHNAIPPRKMELCKFYLMDCCAKREKCLYLHKGFPCKFFQTGAKCYTDEKCKFSHEPLNDITRSILLKHLETAPKEILGDFPRMTRSDALHRLELATERRERGEEPNFSFPNFEKTRESHLVNTTFDHRGLDNDRGMHPRDRPKKSSPERGERTDRAVWGSPERSEWSANERGRESADRTSTDRDERPGRNARDEKPSRADRADRAEKFDHNAERPPQRCDRSDVSVDRQDRSERTDRQDRSERGREWPDGSERTDWPDRTEPRASSEEEPPSRRDRRQRRGGGERRQQRDERRRRRYERGGADRDRSPRLDRHGNPRRRRLDERRGARGSLERQQEAGAERDVAGDAVANMAPLSAAPGAAIFDQSLTMDESESGDKLQIDEGGDGGKSPSATEERVAGEPSKTAEAGSSEHRDSKEPTAENQEFLNSMPASQRNLYLRIQQHQREHVPREDTPQPTADDDERAADDNWYSSDDDDAPPLTAVLKKISSQPTKAPEGGRELAAPKPLLATPAIDPTDAINQLLSSLRRNASDPSRSLGAGDQRPPETADAGRPRRDSWNDRDVVDRDERRRERRGAEPRSRQRRGSWQRRSSSSDESGWRSGGRRRDDSPPGRPRRDVDARRGADGWPAALGFHDVDSRERRPPRAAADAGDPRSQGDRALWGQQPPVGADERSPRDSNPAGGLRNSNAWDPLRSQDTDGRKARGSPREAEPHDPRVVGVDGRDPRAAGDGWQVTDPRADPRAGPRDVDTRDPRDPRSTARDTDARDPRAAAARDKESRDPRSRQPEPRGSPSGDVDLRRAPAPAAAAWPDTDLRLKDTDMRLKDRDMRLLPNMSQPPPAQPQRPGWELGTMDFDKDVNDLPLPFKPVDIKPCVEIDASVNSHPPMEWVVVHVTVEKLDYSIQRYRVTEPQARVDPRIKNARRRGSQEEKPPSARVIPTEPSREYEQMMAPPPTPTPEGRDDPRYRGDPRGGAADPRRAAAAAAALPPAMLNMGPPPGMMSNMSMPPTSLPMPPSMPSMGGPMMFPGMGGPPPGPAAGKPGLLGVMPGVPGNIPPLLPSVFPARPGMPPPMPGYGRPFDDM